MSPLGPVKKSEAAERVNHRKKGLLSLRKKIARGAEVASTSFQQRR